MDVRRVIIGIIIFLPRAKESVADFHKGGRNDSPSFSPTDHMGRETTVHTLRSLIFYLLVVCCCIAQAASQLTAGNEPAGKDTWRRADETVIYRSDAPTKVTVIGNAVIVPVTLIYQGNQLDVQLLLDTGASGTVINADIADRLNINLSRARKARGQVVGGAVIEASQVTLSRITVGPHTKENAAVFVIAHKGPAAKYDGLLGLDILRGLKYSIDFDKQLIIWQ